jgi:hypothetical protein
MLNRILVIVYVVGVLLFSGLTKAQAAVGDYYDLPVTKVSFDTSNYMVRVEGYIPQACLGAPRPQLSADANGGYTLHIVAEVKGEACAQVIVGDYQLVFDFRTLKEQLPDVAVGIEQVIPVNVNGTNESFEVPYRTSEIGLNFKSTEVAGIIFVDERGEYALKSMNGRVFRLLTVGFDLQPFMQNQTVVVSGHALNLGIPLLKPIGGKLVVAPTGQIIVSGISSTLF